MNTLLWIGLAVVLFVVWMFWEVKHAGEMPDDFEDENPVDYDDKWFDDNKPVF